ncbi:MAG: prephenate/arogenate dehydrogenase family protein [Alphaproteobacteria bacterium]|nr:prephenate/arogenate dehydrogenase family protein [Alphaproteobacteria bacterium]
MSTARFEQIALVGIGLIGSSIAHAARRAGLADRIVGSARTAATVEKALQLGIVDEGFPTAAEAARGSDLVVLCTPVGICGVAAKEIADAGAFRDGAILTDVGSVKGAIVRDVAPHVPAGVHFVPGHPIAGTEQSGPESGFAELFDNRWCILTPQPGCDAAAVARLKAFWEALGSQVEIMSPDHHDRVLAITSHVPHLIAFNIVNTAGHLERVTDREVIKFSAGGFRDFTRIAASDPIMWRDVFLNNKEAVLEMLQRFSEDLTALQRAIRYDEGDTLHRLFSEARALRRGIIEAGQDTDAPDFGRRIAAPPPGKTCKDKD